MTNKAGKRTGLTWKILKWLVISALLYSVVGAYIPFARCPELQDAASVETRADEMQRDIQTPDRVMVLSTRREALDERIRLMNRAQREIIITSYDCRDGESTRDLLCVALERADAGVRVRVLIDGIAGVMSLSSLPLFQAMEAHPNVEFRFYNPPKLFMPWRNMGRMHDKYVIVDDTAYILGGRNMFDAFIGQYSVSHPKDDREVLVYNSAEGAAQSSLYALRAYFEGVWAMDTTASFACGSMSPSRLDGVYDGLCKRRTALQKEKPRLFDDPDYVSMTTATKGVWLVSNPTNIYAKQPVVFEQLCALMDRAKSEVIIHSPYAALNDEMRGRLTAVAAKVPVTLMVNAVEHSHNYAGSGDYLYYRGQVFSTGVSLLEYAGDNYYHGKAMLIDDALSIVGCYNLDLRSTYVDTELMLVIRSEEINATLRQAMTAMHGRCRRVTGPDDFETPEAFQADPLPLWKRAALWAVGALLQPVRNLV